MSEPRSTTEGQGGVCVVRVWGESEVSTVRKTDLQEGGLGGSSEGVWEFQRQVYDRVVSREETGVIHCHRGWYYEKNETKREVSYRGKLCINN